MIKRFRWVILGLLVGVVWLVAAGVGQRRTGDDAGANDGAGPTKGSPARNGKLPGANPDKTKGRESSRHRTGEVEKNLATPLEKKVAEQERLVEERRKVLPALARARGMGLQGVPGDAEPPTSEPPEEAAKNAQAVQDFEDARRQYLVDREVLEKLKLELAEEQAKGK